MTSEELNAIEARANAATAGPWEWLETPNVRGFIYGPNDQCLFQSPMPGRQFVIDAAFIAHARTDIPALVARVRELEAVLKGAVVSMRNVGLDGSADVLEAAAQ